MSRRHRNHRTTGQTCIWAGGISLAATAAMIGMGSAHADDGSVPTDIGLLTTAQTDIAEAFSLAGQTPTEPGFFTQLEAIQTPLLSSDNSFVSGVGESLFNGPDQHLAQASESFLSAAEALSSDTTNITALGDYASAGFQVDGAIFGEIPSTLIGKLTDQIFDIGGFDTSSAGAAADVATSAASAASTPDDVIGQALADFNQGDAVLDTASTADLGTRSADLLSGQENLGSEIAQILPQLGTQQDLLTSTDQTLLADVDEQWVTAAQNVLSADQAFVAADQAGQLSGSGFNSADLTVIGADLGVLSADFNTAGATLLALFTGGLDTTATDLASGLDPATAIDPSIFADLLSSIGL